MDTTRFEIGQDGVARLQTSKGVLMVDADDLGVFGGSSKIKIKKRRTGPLSYVADMWSSGNPCKRIGYVSRLIMDAPVNMEVDHINHDTLDNRRCNLRVCTRSENRRNGRKQRQSNGRFKCVVYHPAKKYNPNSSEAKPWRAYTRVMGKRIWLGYYATDIDAAMAYNRYAAKEFGEFACFNRFDKCPAIEAICA